MTGIQLVTIGFALIMLFLTYTAIRRRELRWTEGAIWSAIWCALLFVSLFPALLRGIIVPLHVIRLLDLVTILGLLVMGALLFTLNRALRRLEGRLVKVIQSLALEREPLVEGSMPQAQVRAPDEQV